jgi:hypothetical protein
VVDEGKRTCQSDGEGGALTMSASKVLGPILTLKLTFVAGQYCQSENSASVETALPVGNN